MSLKSEFPARWISLFSRIHPAPALQRPPPRRDTIAGMVHGAFVEIDDVQKASAV